MARLRHLSKAPITEALIDFRVKPHGEVNFASISAALGGTDFGYYIKGPIAQGTFGVRFAADGTQPLPLGGNAKQVGVRLHSADEKYVAQFTVDGFTISRLQPYENWEHLSAEAKRIWQVYMDLLSPQRVNRVATRYINNLQLPLRHGDSYQTYLHRLADVPEGAPQSLGAFLQRFELADPKSGATVVLTSALERPATDGGGVPVILDIEAFTSIDSDPNDEKLWATLASLRELKNNTFFGSIEEKAAELYE